MIRHKNIAFTMSEALIVLGIVAVLATLSVVAITNAKPDENIIMYRRAYLTTLKAIQNLMNDKDLYPNATTMAYNNTYSDFLADLKQRSAAACYDDELIETTDPDNDTLQQEKHYETNLEFLSCGGGGGGGGGSLPSTPASSSTSSTSSSSSSGTSSLTLSSIGRFPIEPGSSRAISSGEFPSGTSSSSSSGTSSSSMGEDLESIGDDLEPIETEPVSSRAPATSFAISSSSGTITPSITSSSSSGNTNIDFNTLTTSVFGRGFSDTEITNDMKTKYPYLNAANASASNKFALSLMSRLNPVENSVSGNTVTYTTPDGIYWSVVDSFNTSDPHATITVQVDGNNSNSCYYNSTSCVNPNKFTFYVEKSGKVLNKLGLDKTSANDPMACSYARYSNVTKQSKISTDKTKNTCFK